MKMETKLFGAGDTTTYVISPPIVLAGKDIRSKIDGSGITHYEVIDMKYEDHETQHLWDVAPNDEMKAKAEEAVQLINLSLINDNTTDLDGDISSGMSIVEQQGYMSVLSLDNPQELELLLIDILNESKKPLNIMDKHAIVIPVVETIVVASGDQVKEALTNLTTVSNLSNLVRQLNIIGESKLLSETIYKRLVTILTRILNEYVAGSLGTGIRLGDMLNDSDKLLDHLKENEPISFNEIESNYIDDLKTNRLKFLEDPETSITTLAYTSILVRLPVLASELGYRIPNDLGWGSVYKHVTPSLHRLLDEVTKGSLTSVTIFTKDGYLARVLPILDKSLHVLEQPKPYALIPK